MARKPPPEEHENHERWLVSYADFVTLLFAFFVVMYSTSSINEGKYRVLSDSLVSAFSGPTRTMEPVQIGQMARSPQVEGVSAPRSVVAIDAPVKGVADGTPEGGEGEEIDPQGEGNAMAAMEAIADQVEGTMASLIDSELVDVRRKGDWLEVEIKNSILFPSGSSRLTDAATPVLQELSEILKGFPNPVQVEGFTDNVPIHTLAFPSNWELSAARAASVVHLFTKYGVHPERMVAIGYGEHRSIAENDTEEGRAKNRRVVIVIPSEKDARKYLDVSRRLGAEATVDSIAPDAAPSPVAPAAVPQSGPR